MVTRREAFPVRRRGMAVDADADTPSLISESQRDSHVASTKWADKRKVETRHAEHQNTTRPLGGARADDQSTPSGRKISR